MLTPRMLAVASLAGVNDTVADIGCDHGKLSAYLIKNKLAQKVYATDISEQSLKKARLLKEKECLKNMQLFLGDGFDAFNKPVDCAIIAGMGGETIKNIISHKYAKTKLVLQPMKDSDILYKGLLESGFYIDKVQIVREGGRFYEIIMCFPGDDKPFDYLMPPLDKIVKDDVLRDFLIHKISVLKKSLQGISLTRTNMERLEEVNYKITKIEDVLNNVYCI